MSKNQYVYGCYATVDEAVDVIKDLKARGCDQEAITLVTREDYVPAYSQIADANFATEEQIMGKETKIPQTEESLWDKVKNSFSVESRSGGRGEPDYRTDDDPLYAYQEKLDKGCIVILLEGAEWLEEKAAKKRETEADSQERSRAQEDSELDFLNAADAMRSNVITSTDKEAVMDSGLVDEDEDDRYLHDNESHTRGLS